MIKNLIEKYKSRKANIEWQRSTLGRTLAAHSEIYFKDKALLADTSDELKNKIIEDFYQQVFSLSHAENPFLEMRKLLAVYASETAIYQVLCLNENDKTETFYADCPYISGELYKHIQQYTKHNDELDKLKWENNDIEDGELIDYCRAKCVLNSFYLNGINYVRDDFDDSNEEKDWLRPFMRSMMISEEDKFRQKLDLPSLLLNPIDSLMHGRFFEIVGSGHKNPYYEWEKSWNESGISRDGM